MKSETQLPQSVDSRSTPIVALRRALLVAVFALVMGTGLLFPFPVSGRFWNEFFNLAHAPAFFLLTVVAAGVLDPGCIGLSADRVRLIRVTPMRAAVLGGCAVAIGAGGELLQQFFRRSASVGDAVANGMGALAAFLWIVSFSRSHSNRMFAKIGCGSLLIAGMWNPVAELYDLSQQHQEFPMLSSLERSRELSIWAPVAAELERTDKWATDGDYSLGVRLTTGAFSGASLDQPIRDWRGYEFLQFDLQNASDHDLSLNVKVVDREHADHDFSWGDRFLMTREVPAGGNISVRIPLAEIAAAPRTRRMDLSAIESLEIYVSDLQTEAEFLIDNVRLTSE